jgi:UDP-glucose 4-epimerase
VYGPRQRRLLLWELFRAAVGPAAEIALQGTGEETRDYLYIDDVANILLSIAIRRPAGLTVLNIASGSAIRTRDLARLVADAVGSAKPVRARGEPRPGNPGHWRASIARLQQLAPLTHRSLESGIHECVRAWQ